jgi:plasmid stabilization system protein ParE
MIVDWSESATAHVVAVREYLLSTSSAYAHVVVDRNIRKTEKLADFPYLGGEVPEYAREGIREVFEHPYRIMYRVHEDRVQIVAVIHAARQLPESPPE